MRHVSVMVDDQHLGVIGTVAEALQARGMQVDQVLDQLGMITGSAPDDDAELWGVEGVASVEGGLDVQLPPPDAPVQ